MKILTALVIVQLLAIGFLTAKVIGLEQQFKANNTAVVEQTQSIDPEDSPVIVTSPGGGITESQVRRVIREELAAIDRPSPTVEQAEERQALTGYELERQFDLVMETLDYHIQEGRISEVDMANLQLEIAKLDKDRRHQAFSALVKAMNTGDLEAEL